MIDSRTSAVQLQALSHATFCHWTVHVVKPEPHVTPCQGPGLSIQPLISTPNPVCYDLLLLCKQIYTLHTDKANGQKSLGWRCSMHALLDGCDEAQCNFQFMISLLRLGIAGRQRVVRHGESWMMSLVGAVSHISHSTCRPETASRWARNLTSMLDYNSLPHHLVTNPSTTCSTEPTASSSFSLHSAHQHIALLWLLEPDPVTFMARNPALPWALEYAVCIITALGTDIVITVRIADQCSMAALHSCVSVFTQFTSCETGLWLHLYIAPRAQETHPNHFH